MKDSAKQGQSLFETLQGLSPESSKSTLRSWLKERRVYVNGVIQLYGNLILNEGDQVYLGPKKKLLDKGIEVLYEDEHLVVIDKPFGLLSVATAFEKGETAHNIIKKKYKNKKVGVVHRLDRETSGVMLFALSDAAYERFKDLFEKHDLDRIYIAVVEGIFPKKSGTWESYLLEDENYYVHSTKDKARGSLAITHFRAKQHSKRNTLMEFKLETGRKNQIRVHCLEAQHPIVGDKKYGASTDPIKRMCLHAFSLSFNHPITHKKMSFTSPVPESFLKLVYA